MGGSVRARLRAAGVAGGILASVALGAALVLARVSAGKDVVPAGAVPGVLQTPVAGACVAEAQARAVWTDVALRLDALELHPSPSGVDAVAEGTAAVQIRQYLQQRLLDQGLTERDLTRLDSITVLQAACGAQPLTVRITETLLQDDYLARDGHVDHTDPGVGQQSRLLESFVRTPGGWKVITIASLNPSPPPGGSV